MRRRTKIAIVAVVGIAITGASVFAAASRRGKGVEVTLQPVQRRDLEEIVSGNGYIRPLRRVDVQSEVMGKIIELQVKEGQQVERNQLLLRIDPTQHEAAAERARAEVRSAAARESQTRAQLEQVERTYSRTLALASGNVSLVSRQELEEAETQLKVQKQAMESATFGVAQAKAALEEALDRVAKTVVRAPMDGVITRLNVDEGSTAIIGTMNNAGSLLLTIADLSVMEAVIRVDETDVPGITIGDSAAIRIDAFPRQTFSGRVSKIAHSSVRPPSSQSSAALSQGQAVDFEIVITLDNPPPGLRSDLSAAADVITEKRTGVLSIPIISLAVRERHDTEAVPQEDPAARAAAEKAVEMQDVEGVFVIREGKAKFMPVQVGISGREHFEVQSGLTESDSVISGPYDAIRALQDGAPVRRTTSPLPGPGSAVMRTSSR